jgi:hypothetical protein
LNTQHCPLLRVRWKENITEWAGSEWKEFSSQATYRTAISGTAASKSPGRQRRELGHSSGNGRELSALQPRRSRQQTLRVRMLRRAEHVARGSLQFHGQAANFQQYIDLFILGARGKSWNRFAGTALQKNKEYGR